VDRALRPESDTAWVLSTERVVARELTPGDLDFVAAMLDDADVMRWYPRRYTRAESEAWIERQLRRYADDGHGLWLVLDRATLAPRGQVGVAMQQVNGTREPEIGYLLHRPWWHLGLATEAATAARDWAFARYPGERVISLIRPENEPSRAVAGRLGMTVAGETLHAGLPHLIYSVRFPPVPPAPGVNT
jgi:ribosomal-protein-alanine N-acetyltransferase